MKSIHAIQIKPLDGLSSGTLREFDTADFDRLRDLGAVREATEEEIKAAPQHLNKMAPAGLNKDIGARRDENGDTADMAQLRTQFDASYAAQGQMLTAARDEVVRLTGHVTSLSAAAELHAEEVRRLNDLIAVKDGEIATLKAGPAPAPLKAEHHGGGKFNITQGETTVASGLTKADADAFNAMSDEDKAAFVAKPKV